MIRASFACTCVGGFQKKEDTLVMILSALRYWSRIQKRQFVRCSIQSLVRTLHPLQSPHLNGAPEVFWSFAIWIQ